ncbi:MAG TPA: FAD-dependent monooxygenase [Pseudonocardia sp.]|jgi:2-polyprenyl-6-methoxyphenol hydroxylase-like FAD-dependent oxidoreductase|nr:FAD-dependent monooxygenase [Pseudonocardia sp.]
MRIVCNGGGPAGLYFAICAKRRDAGHDITVLERDAEGATYGWGIIYWDNLLDLLFHNDMESAREIRAASSLFTEQEIQLRGRASYVAGYGFTITRTRLLEILIARARALGVNVRHNCDESETARLVEGADLVVAADGAGSTLRRTYEAEFGTRLAYGSNRYIWLGSTRVFERFTFAFERTEHGYLWLHGYPSSADVSTCILECTDETWHACGFDRLNDTDGLRLLEKVFHEQLDGHGLISDSRGEPARWLQFREVTNEIWYHRNLVLLGDAAHTTHFTIGSGTRLAIIDAAALAQCLYDQPDTSSALAAYDQRRRDAMRQVQAGARTSMAWFENVERYLDRDVNEVAYGLCSRLGQEPPWRYQQYRLTQATAVRNAQRRYESFRRLYRACRRGEYSMAATAPVPSGGQTR